MSSIAHLHVDAFYVLVWWYLLRFFAQFYCSDHNTRATQIISYIFTRFLKLNFMGIAIALALTYHCTYSEGHSKLLPQYTEVVKVFAISVVNYDCNTKYNDLNIK